MIYKALRSVKNLGALNVASDTELRILAGNKFHISGAEIRNAH